MSIFKIILYINLVAPIFFLDSVAKKIESAVESHTLSLANTDTNSIWFTAFENDKLLLPITQVSSHQKGVSLAPDIRKSVLVAIWFADPGDVKPERDGKKVMPEPDQLYTFTPGKTLYLTWRRLEELVPQPGMLWGLVPESKEGFSLDLNVTPSDIIRIEDD